MGTLASNDNAFIRPSPSAGTLGGVARKTREIIILCEAAGYEVILIETVGVGQSEIAVHSMVDFFLLLMLAGAGDELQGIKRGIMEMADGIAINKADGKNIIRADAAKVEFQNALNIFPPTGTGWKPKVVLSSGLKPEGTKDAWKLVDDYIKLVKDNGVFQNKRKAQLKNQMYDTINDTLRNHFYNNISVQQKSQEIEKQVLERALSPFQAARKLMENYYQSVKNSGDTPQIY
jgi:LAO/AO transport system kinase